MNREGALWIGGVSLKRMLGSDVLSDRVPPFLKLWAGASFTLNISIHHKINTSLLFILQLEEYMTEDFLRNSLSLMGEEDSLVLVKRIRNKYTSALATYGFLTFESDAAALMAMHKLNGKIIPNSQPVRKYFNLN